MHTKHVQRQRIVLVEATAAYFSEQGIGSSSSHPMACRVVATGMFALLANSVSSSGQSITPDTIHSRQDASYDGSCTLPSNDDGFLSYGTQLGNSGYLILCMIR